MKYGMRNPHPFLSLSRNLRAAIKMITSAVKYLSNYSHDIFSVKIESWYSPWFPWKYRIALYKVRKDL